MSEPGWFESRLPLRRWTRELLNEDVPGGASYWYVFGSATAIAFVILIATGIWQLIYYVPTTEHAYDSVNFLRFQVPWGWLIHGLHFWASTAMVVLLLLHLVQTFIWGAFKKPRELTWVLGVVLLLATLLAVFTGTPLPWDKRGYLAAQVGNGIAGSVPLIGGLAKQIMWGGDTIGQLALSRLFWLHITVVPIAIGIIFLLHLVTFRIPGGAVSFSEKRNRSRMGRFWPDQLLKDFIAFSVVFVGLVGLSSYLMTPVLGAADALDATYVGKPDWPFLFLYQLLKFVPGRFEPIAVALVPLLGLAVLLGVPWLDRSAERSPLKRPVAMGMFAVAVIGMVVLSIMGNGGPTEIVSKAAGGASSLESSTTTPAVGTRFTPTAPFIIGNAEHGATVFSGFCESCHGPKGNGKAVGTVQAPGLNPIDPAIYARDPQEFVLKIDLVIEEGAKNQGKVLMPAFGSSSTMSQAQIADVEAYVLRLNGVDRAQLVNPGMDPKLFFFVVLAAFAIIDVAGLIGSARLGRG